MKRRCFCHDYFMRINQLAIAGNTFAAYGNPFLINRPDRLQIQCSRRIAPDALAAEQARLLDAAERGAVLVSPCISPGEKQIARAALDEGLPLIVLLANSFAPKYKPPGRYFDACAKGLLRMLAPVGGGPVRCAQSSRRRHLRPRRGKARLRRACATLLNHRPTPAYAEAAAGRRTRRAYACATLKQGER